MVIFYFYLLESLIEMNPKFSHSLLFLIVFSLGNLPLVFAQKYELKEVVKNDTISYILKNKHVCEDRKSVV